MLAVRVPPSASSTSQSTVIVPLAERVQIDDRPQAAADEPLDFRGAPVDLAAAIALLARRRAAGEHVVLGGDPPFALPLSTAARRSTLAVQSTVVRPA